MTDASRNILDVVKLLKTFGLGEPAFLTEHSGSVKRHVEQPEYPFWVLHPDGRLEYQDGRHRPSEPIPAPPAAMPARSVPAARRPAPARSRAAASAAGLAGGALVLWVIVALFILGCASSVFRTSAGIERQIQAVQSSYGYTR